MTFVSDNYIVKVSLKNDSIYAPRYFAERLQIRDFDDLLNTDIIKHSVSPCACFIPVHKRNGYIIFMRRFAFT